MLGYRSAVDHGVIDHGVTDHGRAVTGSGARSR
jgi:hypothetical protein